MRSRIGKTLAVLAMAVPVLVAAPGTAGAAGDRSGFVAQSRGAGLSAGDAAALQAEIDATLAGLAGRGKQVSPNQIDMNGATLTIPVPGEERVRQIGALPIPNCNPQAIYRHMCAYQREWRLGQVIDMYACGDYFINWTTVGGWDNNQTTGTRPALYWDDRSRPIWHMPAAPSEQIFTVNWAPVRAITNC